MIPSLQLGQLGRASSKVSPYSEDTFDSNTITNYGQVATAFATWTVSGGFMEGFTGNQAILYPLGFSQTDAKVEAVMTQAEDAGLAVRINASTYYLITIADGSAASLSNTIRMFKCVSGAFTQLGSTVTGIGFTRGSPVTFRLQAIGNAITCFKNGVSQIAVTDSAITGAGFVGMRSNGAATQKFDTLRWNFL